MANLYTYVDSLLKPYYKYIVVFIVLFLFVLLARFVYRKYFLKGNNNKKFSNVANANNAKPIMAIYFFHVEWCPHCVKAQPEWDNFKNQHHNTVVNGYLLQCYDINCTDDNGDEVIQYDNSSDVLITTNIPPTPIKISELIKKYEIDSYPTIKLTKDDIVVEYDAKITKDSLTKFINSV
jgi:thiol-disulfide isomerase/thioredoxin